MNNTQFDYFRFIIIVVAAIILTLGVVLMIVKPQKYSMKNPRASLGKGILFIIFTIILNSAKENRWDMQYILTFICLRKVSHDDYLRAMLSLGYIPILLGGFQLLFMRKLNPQKKSSKDY